MNLFDLFENNKYVEELERLQNIITLYALNRDLCNMNNEEFILKNDEDIDYFFDKYDTFENVSDIDINDFPLEKLFLASISIYKKIKNGNYSIDIESLHLPFLDNDSEMKDQISETLSDTYVTIFEKEIAKLKYVKDEKLKKFIYDYQINKLKSKLQECIDKEEYEKAAEIRDEINEL